MASDSIEPRRATLRHGRRRLGAGAARTASALGLVLLGACAGRGEPAAPLVSGGQLAAGLAALAPSAPLSAHLRPTPATCPAPAAAAPGSPLTSAAPRPPPRKPWHEPRIAWIPALKPAPVEQAALPASPAPTIWPAPPKPDVAGLIHATGRGIEPDRAVVAPSPPEFGLPEQAISPGAGPVHDRPGRPGTAPISIAHGLPPRLGPGAAVAISERDDQLSVLDRSAREALLAGDATTALGLYERLSALFPADRSAMLGRALALQQLDREDEAQALYQLLLEADGSDLGAKVALLGILAERAPDEALRLLQRLAMHHPRDSRLPAQIALALARKGDLDGAIAQQRRAVALAPTHLGHRINLAVLQDRAGHAAAAIEAYRGALELATRGGAPTAQLGALAARLEHLRAQSSR